MNDAAQNSPPDSVLAVLEGGPTSLPEASRKQAVSPFAQKIKVAYYGGYEHFERIDALHANVTSQQIIFRWTMRTEIAE